MSEKRRIVEVEEAQAALDRAAWNARHGSREVRAGRFVLGKNPVGEAGARDVTTGEADTVERTK